MTTDPADPRIERGMSRQFEDRRRRSTSGARHVGWKAGFGAPAALQRFGLTGPLVGFLTDATPIQDRSECAGRGMGQPGRRARARGPHWDRRVLEGRSRKGRARPSRRSALRSNWPISTRRRTTSRRSSPATSPPRRRAGYPDPALAGGSIGGVTAAVIHTGVSLQPITDLEALTGRLLDVIGSHRRHPGRVRGGASGWRCGDHRLDHPGDPNRARPIGRVSTGRIAARLSTSPLSRLGRNLSAATSRSESQRSNCGAGTAPTNLSTSLPSRTSTISGMLIAPNRCATLGDLIDIHLDHLQPTSVLDPYAASRAGATMRQGPHHGGPELHQHRKRRICSTIEPKSALRRIHQPGQRLVARTALGHAPSG